MSIEINGNNFFENVSENVGLRIVYDRAVSSFVAIFMFRFMVGFGVYLIDYSYGYSVWYCSFPIILSVNSSDILTDMLQGFFIDIGGSRTIEWIL